MTVSSVVYFVLSHTNAPQVARLIRRLRAGSPEAFVYVHHDAAGGAEFDASEFASDARVRFAERSIHGEWAGFSLVEIVLAGLDELERHGVAYDYLVLLSGQDYPVRPLADFEAALAQTGDGMLEHDENPGSLLDRYRFAWRRAPRRLEFGITHRLIGYLTRLNDKQPFVRFLSGRVGCRVAIRPRRPPLAAGARFYKGTQWWALSARAVAYARDYVRAHPEFVRHYREHTIMPDESFFQTILENAEPAFRFRNDDGRYAKWATRTSASPEVLRRSDYDEIVASRKFFARKFDTRDDAGILDDLDALALPSETA